MNQFTHRYNYRYEGYLPYTGIALASELGYYKIVYILLKHNADMY